MMPETQRLAETPEIIVTLKPRQRNATARLRGQRIYINVPKHWPAQAREEATASLKRRMLAHYQQVQAEKKTSLAPVDEGVETLAIETPAALAAYVEALNRETFNVPVKQVRIGWARYSRLAQANMRTGCITISRYCLGPRIPREAFRYLVLHELAHFLERSHNARFWGLVARYCPDYRTQQRVMRHYFAAQVAAAEQAEQSVPVSHSII